MPLVVTARNNMLDQLNTLATHASLHNAYNATGVGGTELTGGAPAYARKAITWDAATAANKSFASPAGILTFDVPPGATVAFMGLWSALAAGTFQGMFPVGGTGYKEIQIDLVGPPPKFISEAHGFVNGDRVVLLNGTAPTGFTIGQIYFVVSATADTFQLSATSGGAAIAPTTAGSAQLVVSRIIPEVFAGQGTYTVNDFDYSMP